MGKSLQVQSVIYKNEKSSLLRAIKSLSNAIFNYNSLGNGFDDVVLVYGDASPERVFSDEDIKAISNEFNNSFSFKYVFFNENTGTAKGHNKMARECDKDYIMVMNPDVLVCPDFFEEIMRPFLDEKLNAGLCEARQTPIEHPKNYNTKTLETEWASTAGVVFTNDIFKQIGGFDSETFFMYCDDLDFSWRIRLAGKKIYYCPQAVIFHAKTLSKNATWVPTPAEIYYSAEASILMAYKWSNDKRVSYLYKTFKESDNPSLDKAAAHFDELKSSGKLPKQIDKNHKIARFVGDNFTEHRFIL